ncbi:MAG: class I SAM-dependent methyltransferase, partial [bacterium]|nr:class I SAM-dependent methyltransferase [bacterium]
GFFLYSHHIETKQFGSKAAIVGDFGENPEYDAKILKIKEKEKETREQKIIALDKKFAPFELELSQVLAKKNVQGDPIQWHHILKGSGSPEAADEVRLFREYLALLKEANEQNVSVPGQDYWSLFFDKKCFSLSAEDEKIWPVLDKMQESVFDYMAELDPVWCLEHATDARNGVQYCGGRDSLPPRFLHYWDSIAAGTNSAAPPCLPLYYVLTNACSANNGKHVAEEVLMALKASNISVSGKDIAEVGAGPGAALPYFRKACGPNAKLYAADLDPYTVDLLSFTSQFSNAKVVDCKLDNCGLDVKSVDIVLMRAGLAGEPDENYNQLILPLLRSINAALRNKGALVICDKNIEFLEHSFIERIENAGFKLCRFFPPVYDGYNNRKKLRDEFIAVFDKV